ncbi:MAG TPA: PglZ domain-containing protein, partial [Chloroflexota bacterium]
MSPTIQARWALIATAGQALLEASRVAIDLKTPGLDGAGLLQAYTGGDTPWCLLDTVHRHLERFANDFEFEFDFAAEGTHERLQALVNQARRRVVAVQGDLASAFVHAYRDAGFHLPGVRRQRDVFRLHVQPALDAGKTAYLLVDALRYEMARELVEGLDVRFIATLRPALATPPTVTEVGMAALLPGADGELTLAATSTNTLGLTIAGQPLRLREARVDYVAGLLTEETCVLKLDELINLKPSVRTKIKRSHLTIVTSQEIDEAGERGNAVAARSAMDSALRLLRRVVRTLADLGVQTIVIGADHGYLFGEALESGDKIDQPGGETLKLNRRVWVGAGGAANPAYLRARLAEFGIGGGLELATPWTLACFKVAGGGTAYFHGGLSPQEVIIPIATLQVTATATKGGRGSSVKAVSWQWTLQPGSRKLSTRFASVEVRGLVSSPGLFGDAPPRVRVELRDAQGTVIAAPATATYGFEDATGDVQLQLRAESSPPEIVPVTVALLLT